MTTKHTIYVANVQKDQLAALCVTWDIDATIYESQIVVNRLVEWGVVLEIIGRDKDDVVTFCQHLCSVYREEYVLLVSQRVNAELVNLKGERTTL